MNLIEKIKKRRGFTLIEIIIAMTIMAMVMLAVARGFNFTSRQAVHLREKAFATQKGIQMMEELRGLISDSGNSQIGVLDDYDDGALFSNILTTKTDVTSAGDPLSGNGQLKFKRRINVLMLPNEPLARRVYVRVFESSSDKPLVEMVSVLRTISHQFDKTQVFDLYVLCLENVPGWWVSLSTMKPMFDNVIQDLMTRNPGMELRVHYITRLAYGRDPFYTPYVNEATKTNVVSPPSVYFYPGNMDKPSAGSFLYYIPDYFTGRVNVDGVTSAGTYSIADQYNHAVRYPDEVEMHNNAIAAADAIGAARPEMSLRMLIEKMNSTSELTNLLLINLHGELMPLPPMRNYSDPAKDPVDHINLRAVTHPENLEYASGANVKLRVYAYSTPQSTSTATENLGTMTVQIGAALTSGQVSVRFCVGNSTIAYQWRNAGLGSDYTVTNPVVSSQTVITLFNTPVNSTANGNYGLPLAHRLYNMQYIPAQISSNTAFQEGFRDLAWSSTTRPKNTARWVITINGAALPDGQYTIETRLGGDITSGSTANKPSNLSRTYVWVGTEAPETENYQFIGDPRHMPYSDVKNNLGFNWYFTSVNTTNFPNFTNAANLYNGGPNVDVPRYFQVLRTGLINSEGLWSTMTGYTFYYVGLGGEMGYDASNGFANGLPIIETPWVPGGSSNSDVDEITDAQTHSRHRMIARTNNSWYGMYWLGELYPDSDYGTWSATGNLPVGTGNFYRANHSIAGLSNPIKRTNDRGCATFFNGNQTGSGNSYFNHEYWDSSIGLITTVGLTVSQDFNFPLLGSMTAGRPFRLNSTANPPPEWSLAPYSTSRTTLSTLENYYDTQSNTATHDSSSLVRIQLGAKAGNTIVNGLSPQSNFGAAQLSKLVSINLIRGFMKTGNSSVTVSRIPQVPLISISTPTAAFDTVNPTSITIDWTKTWTRWDSQPYTSDYPSNYTDASAVTYNVKYSNDNGHSWYFIQDGATAIAGTRDGGHALSPPFSWDVSALPQGSYIIRAEVYRQARDLHYSYHQVQVYIQR